MVIKIKLKNVDKYVLLDHEVFEALNNLPMFKEYKVFDNLRQHSSGVPVFQKYIDTVNGKLKVESVYLALFIAKKYIPQPPSEKKLFLSFINGDKLDLRLKNLKWDSMSTLSRSRISNHNRTGFRGVRQTPQGKYVSMVSDGVKQIYLGTYDTAEEAALAYNQRSVEIFGNDSNLNPVDSEGKPIPNYTSEKIKRRGRKKYFKPVALNTIEADQISLTPAHFEPLKKRGRKPKMKNEEASHVDQEVTNAEHPMQEAATENVHPSVTETIQDNTPETINDVPPSQDQPLIDENHTQGNEDHLIPVPHDHHNDQNEEG